MISRENATPAYILAVVLLIVGIVSYCYAAAHPKIIPGEEPRRKVFQGMAGSVLFDHQQHTDYEGDCLACHHHGEDASFRACDVCHLSAMPKKEPALCLECHPLSDDPYMEDVHYEHHRLLEDDPEAWSCKVCHELAEGETVPGACVDCHDPDEIEGRAKIMKYQKSADAIHDQCIGCHEDYSAGPVACGECHAQ